MFYCQAYVYHYNIFFLGSNKRYKRYYYQLSQKSPLISAAKHVSIAAFGFFKSAGECTGIRDLSILYLRVAGAVAVPLRFFVI